MAHLFQSTATETELNELLEGRVAGDVDAWKTARGYRSQRGSIGVIFREERFSKVRPLVLIAPTEDQRRLFSRYATLRDDLSPLSAWCHILTPDRLSALDAEHRSAELGGYVAAWTGLIVAEALLLADRPVGQLRIAACLATQSFAVARTKALWARSSIDECVSRHATALKIVRGSAASRLRTLSSALQPIWEALLIASGIDHTQNKSLEGVSEALRMLSDIRGRQEENEYELLSLCFQQHSESNILARIPEISPEDRVDLFDHIVGLVLQVGNQDKSRKVFLQFMAGYIATIAAGGAASLNLTADAAKDAPEIMAWAYVIGGIGEQTVWTSSFEGLGRLVARELERPLHLDEPPACDFSLDEAHVLCDPALSDPLVRLKIKQQRVVQIALLPGVNVAVGLADGFSAEQKSSISAVQRAVNNEGDLAALLTQALWPQIEARLNERERRSEHDSNRLTRKRKQVQGKLSL